MKAAARTHGRLVHSGKRWDIAPIEDIIQATKILSPSPKYGAKRLVEVVSNEFELFSVCILSIISAFFYSL